MEFCIFLVFYLFKDSHLSWLYALKLIFFQEVFNI